MVPLLQIITLMMVMKANDIPFLHCCSWVLDKMFFEFDPAQAVHVKVSYSPWEGVNRAESNPAKAVGVCVICRIGSSSTPLRLYESVYWYGLSSTPLTLYV